MGIFTKLFNTGRIEQKSYSAPQLLTFQNGKSAKFNDWNTALAIKEGYKNSTWVYACVRMRSQAVSSVPWRAEKLTSEGWQHQPDSDLQRLIDRPNPDMDRTMLFKFVMQHLDLSGNSFLSKVRTTPNSLPYQLWVLMPDRIKVIPGSVRLVDEYRYDAAGNRSIPPEDMVQFMYPDPENMYFGVAPLKPAGQAVDIDNEAERFQKVSLENRGLSDLHVEIPEDTDPDDLDRMKKRFNEDNTGARNARRTLFTNAKITQLNVTAAELDFVNSRKFTREEIFTAYGVPPPMLGVYDNATLANIETARQIFWRDTIVPVLDELEAKLNLSLTYEFGSEWRLKYDISNVTALQENYTGKVDNAAKLWAMGVPFNEINEKLGLGLEESDAGEVGYLPAGVLPVDFAGMQFGDTNSTNEEAKSLSPEILSKLGYGK